MLKKFFLNLLSSFMGAWIALVLFGITAVIVAVGVIARMAPDSDNNSVKKHSVLKLSLKGEISETDRSASFDLNSVLSGSVERPQSLATIVKALEMGKENKDIEALYIECNGVAAGGATLESIRRAVADFRKSGKKVIAYSDSYSQGDYYVASAADSVLLNPAGAVTLTGISGTVLYCKDLLDRLGVKIDVVKVGTFKSAVEPYIMNEMSAPARAQLDTLYGTMWQVIRDDIRKDRKLRAGIIDTLINRNIIFCQDARFALANRLVDRLAYKRTVDDVFASIIGKDKKDLNYVDCRVLTGSTPWGNAYLSKDQVAVLYATGEIAESPQAGINCEKLVPEIVRLAEDENVSGLVLRVNSPGGSVFGSEQIAEALAYFKSKKKPFAVSMGDMAASGGYWISADADRIFAEPLTITGSIGIFGMLPDLSGSMSKLGVSPQTVSTNSNGNFNLLTGLNGPQLEAMQRHVERGYDDFVKRVAKGRGLSETKVRTIAEGRVWSATSALKIGLVDQLGSLDDAVKWVADKAGIKDSYSVAPYPSYEPSLWDMIPEVDINSTIFAGRTDIDPALLRMAYRLIYRKPVQALMPPMEVRI